MAKMYIMIMGPMFFAALLLAGWSAKQFETRPGLAKKGMFGALVLAGIPLVTLMVLAYQNYGV